MGEITTMKISIIIPVYNRIENIKKVFMCLARQQIHHELHQVKVILVDDGSNDGTDSWIGTTSFPFPFTYIKRPREHDWSASKPRNQGARTADIDSDAFYFLDSDVLLPPDRVQRLIDDYLTDPDPNRIIIGPYHYLQQPIDVHEGWHEGEIRDYAQDVRWQSFEEHPVEEKNQGIGYALACFGGSLLIPRPLFFKTTGYDEFVTSGCEDGDYGLTLWETGAVFSLDKGLLAWHHPHSILPARTDRIPEMIKYIDEKHKIDLVKKSGEAYRQWGINWKPDDVWGG